MPSTAFDTQGKMFFDDLFDSLPKVATELMGGYLSHAQNGTGNK
jgi:hypothetical protein